MAAQINHVKIPLPRKLETKETMQSLQQWMMQFKQYMKQDDNYRGFLASDVVWNPAHRTYGFEAEAEGLRRTAVQKMDDCKDFLRILCTFLPHGYLTTKLVDTSTSLTSAFGIIEEHYGLLPSQETFIDLESLNKQTGESYRQFYERLMAHVRQHLLATAGVAVDGATVAAGGDKLTVSHMNMVALMWLRKIHPELLNIVRTEYSLELRNNSSLASLVPRISVSIDSLLTKYDKIGQVNFLQQDSSQADVCRTFVKNRRFKPNEKKINSPFCPGCFYLGQKMKTAVHFKHLPAECPREPAVVKLIEAENDLIDGVNDLDLLEDDGKIIKKNSFHNSTAKVLKNIEDDTKSESCFIDLLCQDKINSAIVNVSSIMEKYKIVRKEKSPTLSCTFNDSVMVCLVDEGSEINCMSYDIALRNAVPIVETPCKAVGAGKSPMNVIGMTKHDIIVDVIGGRVPAQINLGQMIVIQNLGTDVLLGQPAKVDNEIVTFPHKKSIQFKDNHGLIHSVSYPIKNDDKLNLHQVVKVSSSQTLYPGEHFIYKLPSQFSNQRKVMITQRPSSISWIRSRILNVDSDKCIVVSNDTNVPIFLKKHEHIADIRSVKQESAEVYNVSEEPGNITKIVAIPVNDYKHLEHFSDWDHSENFIDDVKIDPDNVMDKHWKDKFWHLCQDYSDIINYRPSRYNGYYGDVSTSIDFASIPPPTNKVHSPKYSDKMKEILAQKMDQLEEWHVLAKPEDLGIIPVFVSPSMLTPKEEKDQWRLITDFSSLNTHIKKMPSFAPTIEETKLQIAKFRYIATLDLSNYYYQHGLRIEDCQYLATPHPFKGLRVYTVKPQGLKNSSEIAYERLSRVYGDLCQEGKMARQADGLYVGGDSLEELFQNLGEVFERTRKSNLTLKPSKVIIAPQRLVLFGWVKNKQGWEPTEHTVTPLSRAEPPSTVKQLRGFLGAIKQLSSCIENYGVILSPLEKVVAGKGSAEKITWTDELLKGFDKAKNSLKNIRTIYTPKPDDTLHTFSDWSQSHGAAGGRLEVHRMKDDGTIDKLHGGFYSAKVSNWQQRWLPCEAECLSARLVLQHFKTQIQCSNNPVIHHTDSMPTFQAWKKAKTGAFSSSARIATFLTEIADLNVEFVHTPGKNMNYSDYSSRHAAVCHEKNCQICSFISDLVFVGDNVVRNINVEDINKGIVQMPFTQQNAWKHAQFGDKTLVTLRELIKTGQLPEKRKTCGDFTILKLLHNLFRKGDLQISSQGLITVSHTQESGVKSQAIVVPTSMYPGLVHAIHIKTMHASKQQMFRLMSRYFYTPGHQRVISEVVDRCHTCLSLKQLPKELFPETTGEILGFGSHFACDVMVRNRQKVLLIREKLSQFTMGRILERETADEILNALIMLIADFIPDYGTVIRTDNAPQFQKLSSLDAESESWLRKFNIKLELGSTFNSNKNPIAENMVKEVHKEINKAGFLNEQINDIQLMVVLKNINSRVRDRGLSAKEMCFMRDQATNKNIVQNDVDLRQTQHEKRIASHNKANNDEGIDVDVGDHVMIKDQISKLKPREKFVIVSQSEDKPTVTLQKQDSKFTSRQYEVPKHQLLKVPTPDDSPKPKRKAAIKAREKLQDIANLLNVEAVNDSPKLYAWDDLENDDETCYVTFQTREDLEQELENVASSEESTDDQSSDHNDTIVEVSNDEFEECHEGLESSPEATASKVLRPDNIDNVQLDQVQRLNHILEENRAFLAEHPRPPLGLRPQRNVRRPTDYSDFSKTGKK